MEHCDKISDLAASESNNMIQMTTQPRVSEAPIKMALGDVHTASRSKVFCSFPDDDHDICDLIRQALKMEHVSRSAVHSADKR